MATIKEVHDRLLFELNKSEYGYISHTEIDEALHRAQLAEIHYLVGSSRQIQDVIGYGSNQTVNNALLPFIEQLEYVSDPYDGTNNGTGLDVANEGNERYIVLPSNWMYTLEVVKDGGIRLDMIPAGKVSQRLRSQINTDSFIVPSGEAGTMNAVDFTTAAYRVYKEDSGFKATLYYIREPEKPLYSFTQTGRVVVHDASTSTDLEWADLHVDKIIQRTLGLLAINVNNDKVLQVNSQKINE